jgi:hypothetical protein
VLLGDFNAFPFNDGYVDGLGTIKGTPTPSNEVTLASADLVQPDLIHLTDELPPAERYSFSFAGNAQALDHILVNAPMRARLTRHAYARIGADFPESFRSDFKRPERVSDHDAPVAWFALAQPPRFTGLVPGDSGAVEVRWMAEPFQSSVVEASADLTAWRALGTVVADESGAATFSETNAPGIVQRFYRAVAP